MKRQSYNDVGHAHFLTFTCYRRQQFLTDHNACQWLIQSLAQARKQLGFYLWAWVLMPEHVHMLVRPLAENYSMSCILQAIKGPFARRIVKDWRVNAPHKLRRLRVTSRSSPTYRFWQAGGGFDRNIYQLERINRAIEYIEHNPVRRGLVIEPTEWRWSSARARAGASDVPIAIDDVSHAVDST